MWRKLIKKNRQKSICNFQRKFKAFRRPIVPKIGEKMQIQGQIKWLLDEFA
jgi:hypothetical protein